MAGIYTGRSELLHPYRTEFEGGDLAIARAARSMP